MPNFLRGRSWGRQNPPNAAARINWAHPISRRLADAALFVDDDLQATNLVTGVRGTSSLFPPKSFRNYPGRQFNGVTNDRRIDLATVAAATGEDYSVWALHTFATASGLLTALDSDLAVAGGRKFQLHVNNGVPYFSIFNTAGTQTTGGPASSPTLSAGSLVSHGGFVKGLTVNSVAQGQVVGSSSFTGTIASDFNGVRVGRFRAESPDLRYNGVVHAVARWRRALLPEEWALLHAQPWVLFAPNVNRVYYVGLNVVTGTGAVDGLPGVVDGDGTTSLAGDGALGGLPGVLDGAGEISLTGTGAIDGRPGVLDGTGTVITDVSGDGALDGKAGVLDGAGAIDLVGSGAVDGRPGVLDGAGAGAGAIDGRPGVLTGAGTVAVSLFDSSFLDEFDVENILVTEFIDRFDITTTPGFLLTSVFIDKFDVFQDAGGFNDTFDILPSGLIVARGVPTPGMTPGEEAQVRRDSRVQMPIGRVDA
jgi:hypothetical protein